LLEEQLPGRDRGADDRDDQQHHFVEFAVFGQLRDQEVVADPAQRRMDHHEDRHQQQAAEHQDERKALETAEVPCAGGTDDDERRQAYAPELGHAQVVQAQADADELGDDGERVQQEQVDDAESAPELAETLEDQASVAHAGDGAQAQHHLLVDVQHRDQQQQGPQQRSAVVLPGLRIGAEGTGVVVADHHDQARTQNRQQRLPAVTEAFARPCIAVPDRAEGTPDITGVRRIEHGRRLAGSHVLERLGLKLDRHDAPRSAGAAHGRERRFGGHAGARHS